MGFRFQDIQHVVYINLDSRPDRKRMAEAELSRMGWTPQRIEAIKYVPGAIGCSFSHIRTLEHAKRNNWDHVLVCEDDIQFLAPREQVRAQIDHFLESVPDWDVVLFNTHVLDGIRVTEQYAQILHAHATTCYLVRQPYLDRLLDNFRAGIKQYLRYPKMNSMYAIDVYWNQLICTDRWYLPLPLLVTQHSGPSDLVAHHHNEDYTKLFTDAIRDNLRS